MNVLSQAMWTVYNGSFKRSLKENLNENDADKITKLAKKDYEAILSKLPPFEKGDRFKINIINCAMLTAFLKNLSGDYTVEEIRVFYRKAMDNKITRFFCTHGNTYTEKGQKKLASDALLSQSYTNPYTWKFTFEKGNTLNQYTVKFYTCGICRMMTDYGLERYIPAMCTFDYDMAAMNNTEFKREYTLALGGPYCDCNYNHLGKV